MSRSFIEDNCVIFDSPSGRLCVGDLVNDPAVYDLPYKGLCYLPAAGIVSAKGDEVGAFAVDNAQIFFVDAEKYESIAEEILNSGGPIPDVGIWEKLRAKHGLEFGVVAAGDLHDCAFEAGDGCYRIDTAKIETGSPNSPSRSQDAKERLRKLVSSMNTLVCAKCFKAELQIHPQLGRSPVKGKAKKEWALAMAEFAVSQGWTATDEPGDFGDSTAYCPECRKKAGK